MSLLPTHSRIPRRRQFSSLPVAEGSVSLLTGLVLQGWTRIKKLRLQTLSWRTHPSTVTGHKVEYSSLAELRGPVFKLLTRHCRGVYVYVEVSLGLDAWGLLVLRLDWDGAASVKDSRPRTGAAGNLPYRYSSLLGF
jgi:hypothetical protein